MTDKTQPVALDGDAIRRLLPHRDPMLLVDEVTLLKPGERAEGLKRLHRDDRIFEGHFPSEPIMPGVLIVEACAQLGAIALAAEEDAEDTRVESGKATGYLASINRFKFTGMAVPGDLLILESQVGKRFGSLIQLKCVAKLDRRTIASGDVSVAMAK